MSKWIFNYLQISCKQFVFTDPAFYQANRMKILTDNYSAFSPKDPARPFYRVGCKASSKEFWVESIQYTCLLLMPTLRFLAALSSIFMLYKELRNKMPEQSPTTTRNHCINCMNFLWMLILFQTELSSLSLLSPGWGVLLSFSQTGSDQSAIMF